MAQYDGDPASGTVSPEISSDSEVLEAMRLLSGKIKGCQERLTMLKDKLIPILAVQGRSTVPENAKEPTVVKCPLAMQIKGDCDRVDELQAEILALRERLRL